MPGDKFQPRKGQEVNMLRKTLAQEDLTAPKLWPKRTSKVTTLSLSKPYYKSSISATQSEIEHLKTKYSTGAKVNIRPKWAGNACSDSLLRESKVIMNTTNWFRYVW